MKERRRRWGTGALMAAALVGVVLAIVGPLLFVVPDQTRAVAVDLEAGQLEGKARALAGQAGPLLADGNRQGAATLAGQASESLGLVVTIRDANGSIIAVGGQEAAGEAEVAGPDVGKAIAGAMGRDLRPDPASGVATLHVSAPVAGGGSVLGVVEVAKPLPELESAVAQTQRTIAVALLLGVLLAAVVALWLAGRVTRPVRALTRAAAAVGGGDYEHELPLSGAREVVELGEAFGRMARALNATFANLRAERDRLDAVLHHMADGILIANADGVITLANPASGRILGIDHQQAVGKRLALVVRDYEIIELSRRCLAGEGKREGYTASVERASPRRYLRVLATRAGEGRDAQLLLLLQDLSEYRRLEVVRRDFLANVSHELRTPLAAIKAMVETLEDGAIDDPPAARDFVVRVHREVDGLSHLVEELLQLSRIESGQVDLRLEEVEPADFVQHTVERLLPLAERAGVQLAVDVDDNLPPVRADRERAGQVLTNILHNAIKFTPPGGSITVSARGDAGGVAFAVADTGAGIADDDLPRLFERFYKADKARASGGTGLGLAIAKHLVQAHGGRVWAESAGPGQGATFTFVLPAA